MQQTDLFPALALITSHVYRGLSQKHGNSKVIDRISLRRSGQRVNNKMSLPKKDLKMEDRKAGRKEIESLYKLEIQLVLPLI